MKVPRATLNVTGCVAEGLGEWPAEGCLVRRSVAYEHVWLFGHHVRPRPLRQDCAGCMIAAGCDSISDEA